MRYIITIAVIVWSCQLTMAQTLTVRDKKTNEPVELATISSNAPKEFTTTNEQGEADISNFKGSELIEVRIVGYETARTSYQQLQANEFLLLLSPSTLSLDQVVVSATRWRQNSSDIPAKIIAISPEQVAFQNPQTAADLLGVSGKVYIQKSQQGGGSPMIRGFATNRLLYTIDGIRMNTAIFRGGNIQNVISMDPFAIENTEVLFGPGSVIYGSDAIGGVMSFQSLTPTFSSTEKPLIKGNGTVRYASANQEQTGHFDVNIGWKKWAFVSSISSWDYDHLRQGSNGPDDYLKPYYVQRIDSVDKVITQDDPLLQIPSAYSQINTMQKLRFKPNDAWDFQYAFHYSETSPYGRYDRHNRMRNGLPRYGEWNYGPQKWMMNNLSITHVAEGIYDEMSIHLAAQSFEESRISRNLNSAEREVRTEEVAAYSANVDFIKALNERNQLFYGIEYVTNDVTSSGMNENIDTGTSTAGPARYPQADWNSIAIYLNDELRLSDQFTLQGGLRYNQFMLDATFDTRFYDFPFSEASINNGALTGSIGAVYRPSDSWVISTNFGTAFRSPNVDDIGKVFDSEPGAVVVPNPDLKAEYAYNIDVGIAKVFNDVVKLDVTAYATQLQNAMVRRDFQLNGQDSILYDGELSQVQALQNAAKANVFGIQAGLEWLLPAGFRFSSDLNYQKGEEELDDGSTSASRHAAPLFGQSRFTYKNDKLTLQFYAQYQGERSHEDLSVDEQGKDEIYAKDENGNTYAPFWYTLNLKAMYQLTDQFSINAGIENLSDQRYRPYSSGISAAGRNFLMALNFSF
jgi:hemoglobin/transferrin/lactoferrin receptor protein